MRIKINIHVCSDIQLRKDNREVMPSDELPELTERITAGVENGTPALNGPVNVTQEPASSLVCRMAYTRTW